MLQTMNFSSYLKLARLHRPTGIWLLLLPGWWGIALASASWPSPRLLTLFAIGAILMRSAGCIYNDIVDRDFDRNVTRTASRPLAAGVLSVNEAYGLLLLLLGLSALILFSLPLPVIMTGFIALGLVFLYPWMKRITYWPQVFLGVTFNIGVLMGWLCLHPHLSVASLLFYAGGIFWTLGYDTIYAFQDEQDDLLVGVKSSALAISKAPKLFMSLIYGLTVLLWGLGGIIAHLSWVYVLVLSLISLHFIWQIFTLEKENTANCLARFESNTQIGILLFLGIVFSRAIN